MFYPSQKLEGITNMVFDKGGKPTDKRYCFWDYDLENCAYEQVKGFAENSSQIRLVSHLLDNRQQWQKLTLRGVGALFQRYYA